MMSDACFEFYNGVRTLAEEFKESVEHYGSSDYPIPTEPETVMALRKACRAALPQDAEEPMTRARIEALCRLVMLAYDVGRHLDHGPRASDSTLDQQLQASFGPRTP